MRKPFSWPGPDTPTPSLANRSRWCLVKPITFIFLCEFVTRLHKRENQSEFALAPRALELRGWPTSSGRDTLAAVTNFGTNRRTPRFSSGSCNYFDQQRKKKTIKPASRAQNRQTTTTRDASLGAHRMADFQRWARLVSRSCSLTGQHVFTGSKNNIIDKPSFQ